VKVIFLPTDEAVLVVNKYICEQGFHPAHCFEVGKIEGAISTAFYPGTYPNQFLFTSGTATKNFNIKNTS